MTAGPDKTKPDPAPKPQDEAVRRKHQEEMLDEALKGTFPASDPIAPATPERERKPQD